MKEETFTTLNGAALFVFVLSVFAVIIYSPGSKNAWGKYNDTVDITYSQEVASDGVTAFYSHHQVMGPALLCHIAFDKHWRGELEGYGAIAFIGFLVLTGLLMYWASKRWVGVVLYGLLIAYFAIAVVQVFIGLINNTMGW